MKNIFLKKYINSVSFFNDDFSDFLLKDLVFIKVIGKDSEKYLNSQLTANLFLLKKNNYLISGHCNVQGKLIGILKIFKVKNNEYFYVIRNDIYKNQINILKKYSIFSKVYFFKKKMYFLGILSIYFKKKIFKFFFKEFPSKKKNVFYIKNCFIIRISDPEERFLLILSKKKFIKLKNLLYKKKYFLDQKKWDLLEIVSKIPIFNSRFCSFFYPQELGLHKIKNSLSFKKGCFYGQEMISKIQYLGNIKNKLVFLFSNFFNKKKIPKVGSIVFLKKDKNFYRKGVLIKVIVINKKKIFVQAVIKNFIKKNKIYYIEDLQFKIM